MGGSKGLADVLRGLIELVPILAWLVAVLAAVAGIALAGYAMIQVYKATTSGEGSAGNWIVAAVIGSSMTIATVVIANISFYFAD
ncbi:hypothetical protein [Methylobacterium indicum]|uniref:Integral membrane protein n=1 Tax=Methylobacterium indicum TaxID=1775910 RepID=A0ABR5H2S1_9HYPH|nr:hypothetical protein [Methylobacterium indicum]KMO13252.1 hypothetical protein QR78_25525 [Methylobacterium indicum]KMO17751.1 hypothetical protein QR79_21310 [Methylobacterium indicum]